MTQVSSKAPITHRLRNACNHARVVMATLMLRTNMRRWQQVAAAGPPTWDERNTIIARFIPPGSAVLDIGAGAQTLKRHLPEGCAYQPCDVVQSTPDVLPCDLNRQIYPKLGRRYDVVVCSGVLEYVWRPLSFLRRLPDWGETILLSYNPRAKSESRLSRLAKHWVNHLTRPQLEALFKQAGLAYELINQRDPNEHLYRLRRSPERSESL